MRILVAGMAFLLIPDPRFKCKRLGLKSGNCAVRLHRANRIKSGPWPGEPHSKRVSYTAPASKDLVRLWNMAKHSPNGRYAVLVLERPIVGLNTWSVGIMPLSEAMEIFDHREPLHGGWVVTKVYVPTWTPSSWKVVDRIEDLRDSPFYDRAHEIKHGRWQAVYRYAGITCFGGRHSSYDKALRECVEKNALLLLRYQEYLRGNL